MGTRGLPQDPTRSPLRCAVYARVSSDRQDVENSLDRQLSACREWAQRSGHLVLEEPRFVDEAQRGKSMSGASLLARPAFQRLLELLRGREPLPFDAVLVDDDSRIDRGGRLAEVVSAFQARGVGLIPVDSGRDLTDEGERLLVHVKSGLNEHYLHELSRRTRNGLAAKVRRGFHAGGRTYGYKLVGVWPSELPPDQRHLDTRIGVRVEIDEDQARVVRRIFELYVGAGVGLKEIAHRLNAEGVPSSRGRTGWDPSGVRVVLTNPKYVGDWSWNHRRWQKVPEALLSEAERERAKLTGRHPRRPSAHQVEDVVEHHDESLRIVGAELWAAVRARFEGRKRTTKGGRTYNRSRHPIAGLLRCRCGGAISLATVASKGHTYRRLGCAWNQNRGSQVCDNGVRIRLEALATPLLAYVRDELLAPERVEQAVDLVNRKIDELARRSGPSARSTTLSAEVARLEAEVARLVDALAKGTAYSAIADALAEKDGRLLAVRAELAALARVRPAVAPRHLDAGQVQARLSELQRDLEQLDGDRARLALQRILGEVEVHPLGESWAAGWRLKLQARPWAVLLPRGGDPQVVREFGCGGPLVQPGMTSNPAFSLRASRRAGAA